MSNNRELVGRTDDPEWIIFREKSVKKLSFYIRCYNEGHFFLTADMDSRPADVVKQSNQYSDDDDIGYYTVVETTINGDKRYSFIDGYNESSENIKICLWRQDDNSVKIIRNLSVSDSDDNLWIFKCMRLVEDDEPALYYEDLNEAQQKIMDNIISWKEVFDSLKNKEGRDIFSYQKKCYVNLNNEED
jgi:hypothetical protein